MAKRKDKKITAYLQEKHVSTVDKEEGQRVGSLSE
jgi:hypothetical protein